MRSVLKAILGEKNWSFLSWSRDRFGLVAAISTCLRAMLNGGVGRVPTKSTNGDVYLRAGTADQSVYDQIFVKEQYQIDFGDPRFIIDAGAHVGMASVYLARKYPQATIVSIEPEPTNFAILQKNAALCPNIKPINAGLWSKKTFLRIEDSGVDTWSFRVLEDPTGKGIPAVSIPDVMADNGAQRVDVAKIDIEGSEVEVLNHSGSWIDSVGTIIIELHDRFKPGCSEALDKAISGHTYDRSLRSGENIVISNLKKK